MGEGPGNCRAPPGSGEAASARDFETLRCREEPATCIPACAEAERAHTGDATGSGSSAQSFAELLGEAPLNTPGLKPAVKVWLCLAMPLRRSGALPPDPPSGGGGKFPPNPRGVLGRGTAPTPTTWIWPNGRPAGVRSSPSDLSPSDRSRGVFRWLGDAPRWLGESRKSPLRNSPLVEAVGALLEALNLLEVLVMLFMPVMPMSFLLGLRLPLLGLAASRCWAIGSEMLTGESLGATISLFSPGASKPRFVTFTFVCVVGWLMNLSFSNSFHFWIRRSASL
mmetsp:Transcript_39415/g.116889  ORF Transcript_39415/g.116889 Transcript_39415/m.116889 type:complete len:281 (+) Transcript_39415:364-1206(+)